MSKYYLLLLVIVYPSCRSQQGQGQGSKNVSEEKTFVQADYVTEDHRAEYFPLFFESRVAPLIIDSNDYKGVGLVAEHLGNDIKNVTGTAPILSRDVLLTEKNIVLAGTIGKNSFIDALIKSSKLDVSTIENKWETFLIHVINDPFPNIEKALVIVGSDKRGTIYGMFELSKQIGVSPWHWWADVPTVQRRQLFVRPGPYSLGEPKVKYRGIFINDEAPALAGWAHEKFGGFNHKFYEKVYELILRMKGNYLWPAMWGRAIYDDDPKSPGLADDYGIVIGTSHHEPLMRAHVEWSRYGEGPWNYDKNKERLQEFWKEGIERMGDNESIISIGMRGDGDEPMSEESNIELLEKIVADQRNIIEDVTGKPAEETPQLWALYKEVQDYYDKGMRVPDDVTLLLCDDNWGNIRKLPSPGDTLREGGYGIYYHYDYVGGPRNYKWLNTNQISRVWEQMHLAYEHGVKEIWIVNVGDIKPMEFPIEFFLDYAWNPDKIEAEDIPEYTKEWAAAQFGEEHAPVIAEILSEYTRYNSRRKPELLSPETYSLVNYHEYERVVGEYNTLVEKAERVNSKLGDDYKSAFYQLVLFPVKASANLNELYYATAKNRLYAKQKRVAANEWAEKARNLFQKDIQLTQAYHAINSGKWNHMMSQTHIGYTYWQQPDKNSIPELSKYEPLDNAKLGLVIEGSEQWWPKATKDAVLPEFNSHYNEPHYIEIYNQGMKPFEYNITSSKSWFNDLKMNGTIEDEHRIYLTIDWDKVPEGKDTVLLTIQGTGDKMTVKVPVLKFAKQIEGHVVNDGYVSIEAENYTRKVETNNGSWTVIPELGRTKSGITIFPVTGRQQEISNDSPHLEYDIYLNESGAVNVNLYFSPTLNFHNSRGLKYAVALDDHEPVLMNLHENESNRAWEGWVSNNIIHKSSQHNIQAPGQHTLKFWIIDPGIVLQKIVVETKEAGRSYLGPPPAGL